MAQVCIAGLAGGNVGRASLICKLGLEREAQEDSKSGISQGLLKSFFTSCSPFHPHPVKGNFVLGLLRAGVWER